MPGNLDAFHRAQTRLEETEKRASALVQDVKGRLSPLFQHWQRCFPITSPTDNVPPLLMRADLGGPPERIDVANLPDVWKEMQTAMAEYAEVKQEAAAVLERLTPEEKSRLEKGLPPGPGRFRQR